MEVFKTGVVDDKPDIRNYLYEEKVGGGEPFDWGKGYDVEDEISERIGKPTKLKTESQNGSLSCVGQGWSKYSEVLNVFDEGVLRDFSAKDVYSHIFLPGGCATVGDGAKWIVEHGIEEEVNVPSYMGGKAPTEEFMEQVVARNEERARKFRALSYLTTTHNDIDFLAMIIRDNHGMVSSYIGSNSGWTSKILLPPKTQDFGHCTYFGKAKLINGVKRIALKNSGGDRIGENGWQWMGADYFGYLKNIWTLRDLITNQENMIVDQAKLEQIYQEMLIGSAADDPGAKEHLGKTEDEVRKAVGQSDERQRIIACINAARSVLKR
jgi:hypothetical protein